jgi:hypothetical protein
MEGSGSGVIKIVLRNLPEESEKTHTKFDRCSFIILLGADAFTVCCLHITQAVL